MSTDEVKEVKVDGDAILNVADVPVNLPEKVTVVDAKYGKEIGYVDRVNIEEKLQDGCFSGFEDSATGEFMLAYSQEAVKKMTVEHQSPTFLDFVKVIRTNIETIMVADDPKLRLLGVTYEDRLGTVHVVTCRPALFQDVADCLHPDLVRAMEESSTEGLVEVIRNEPTG